MIDLNNILLFVNVVQAGGFSAASQKIDIPANTISRRIGQLEDSLGVLLLIRTTRKLNLTTAGQRYFEECLSYIQGLEHANQNVLMSQREAQGVVRVTASVDFFKFFSYAWVIEFMQQHPKIELSFLLDNRNLDLVEDNIDIAVRISKLEDSSLIAKKVSENKAGLFASPALFEQYAKPKKLEDLKHLPCILKPSDANGATWVLQHQKDQQKYSIHVNGRFKVNSVVDQFQAVKAGLGIGLLPCSLALVDVKRGNLVPILEEYWQDLGGIYIVTPTLKFRSPAVQLVVDLLNEKLNLS